MHDQFKEIDTKELEFADTIFVHDIEARVFQAIMITCLSEIENIAPLEGNLLNYLLGREGNDRIKGIHVQQDEKNHSVSLKVEVNVAHGISIPAKAEEIQTKIVAQVSQITGLHVSCVHVVFKALITPKGQPSAFSPEKGKEETKEYATREL